MRVRPSRALILLLLSGGAGACVTRVVDDDAAPNAVDMSPVVIPLTGERSAGPVGPVGQYYASVIVQMQEALAGRELPRLQALLSSHDRDDAPAWAAAQITAFRAAALGLAFELHATEHGRVALADPRAPIGAPLDLAFRLPGLPGHSVELGGVGAGLSFLATITLVDHDAGGGRSEHQSSRILPAPARELTPDAPLELRFRAELPGPDAALREVHATIELLPGAIGVDGTEAPVHRTALARADVVLYPEGSDAVRANPLRTLREAIALGGERWFRHQYLAAHAMPAADRDAATELLVQQVRLGGEAASRVAMACLAVMTGVDIPVGDRDGWLRWWQDRAGAGR